jgi:hypothetical protein
MGSNRANLAGERGDRSTGAMKIAAEKRKTVDGNQRKKRL